MTFASVPNHILVAVLEGMDTRSVVRASVSCRAMYEAAGHVRSLRPVIRPHTAAAQLEWVSARRERVTHLRAVRLSPLSPWWTAVRDLPGLRVCMIALSRVPPSIFHALPPHALQTLDIHQLAPGLNDVFSTRSLARFPALRRAHITFAPGWALAIVGPGELPRLETLELRRVPAIAVTASLQATHHVGLHALDVMSGRVHVAPRARSLALRCDDARIDTLPELVHADVEALSLNAQDIDDLGDVQAFPRLTALHLASHFITVPDARGLTQLTRLQLDAVNCLVFDKFSAVPPGLRILTASSQHRPLDITPYLDRAAASRETPAAAR